MMKCAFSDKQGETRELTAAEYLLCPHNRTECSQAERCPQIKQKLHTLFKPPANALDRINYRMR
jgi:hypothetical protein